MKLKIGYPCARLNPYFARHATSPSATVLGDAMLSAVIASYLFQEVPSGDEGYLTQMRSKIVSREHLNELGKDLDLFRFVRSNVVKSKFGENIHGNIFEALIGAIYLDRGYTYCKK